MNMVPIDLAAEGEAHAAEGQKDALDAERAFFSSLTNLLQYRQSSGLKKRRLADRFGTDAGTVTRLTTRPSNLKISTIARFARALDARAMLIFVADEDPDLVFTSNGIRSGSAVQSDVPNRSRRLHGPLLGRYDRWVEQPGDSADG